MCFLVVGKISTIDGTGKDKDIEHTPKGIVGRQTFMMTKVVTIIYSCQQLIKSEQRADLVCQICRMSKARQKKKFYFRIPKMLPFHIMW